MGERKRAKSTRMPARWGKRPSSLLEGILPSSGPQVAQLSRLKFLTHKAASKIKWLF